MKVADTCISDLGVELSAADSALQTSQLFCTGLAASELVLNDFCTVFSKFQKLYIYKNCIFS